jgi:hypothetical protein
VHAIRQARRLHQALHVRDLGRDRGSGCADGDETEVCRAFRRRLEALVCHFYQGASDLQGKLGSGKRDGILYSIIRVFGGEMSSVISFSAGREWFVRGRDAFQTAILHIILRAKYFTFMAPSGVVGKAILWLM